MDTVSYCKIYPTTWIREFAPLPDLESKYLAIYLKTNRHCNMTGLYYLPYQIMSLEMSMDLKKVVKAMKKLSECGIAFYDEMTQHVYVVSYAGENVAKILKPGDNRLRAIQNRYDSAPRSPLCDMFWEEYGAAYGLEKRKDHGTVPSKQLPFEKPPPTPPPEPPGKTTKEEIVELLERYTPEQQESIMLAWEMVALTRSRGKVVDNILLTELRRWSKIGIRRVMHGVLTYIDREFYKQGKDEKYLYGIMNHTTEAEIDKLEASGNGEFKQQRRRVSSITEHNIAILKQLREEEGYGMPVDAR